MEKNIIKFFIYVLTQRRIFLPILTIYFLTFPNSTIQQIGIFMAIGNIVGFFLEIPSGYLSDLFGHKKSLILSKLFLLIATTFYVIGNNVYYYSIAVIFQSIGLALSSGTLEAFMQETLIKLNKENDYSKIVSKARAKASLVSIIFIIALPFLSKIDLVLPLKVSLLFDIIGVITAFTFKNPSSQNIIKVEEKKTITQILKEVKKTNYWPMAIFTGSIFGFLVSESNFRYIYLESLGFPVILVGTVLGLSRFFWYIIGSHSYKMEKKLTIKQHLFLEIFIFPFYLFLIAYLSNPYVIAVLIAIFIGYFWGRDEIINHYILTKYVTDKKYKATILSIKSQMGVLFIALITFLTGFIIKYTSYKTGFYTMSIMLFFILSISYYFIEKE